MIVYGSSLSPYVRKTLAFAAEKGIEVELQPAGFGGGPPEFKLASPFGKMPGFKDGDFLISDSTAIITYLEALKPDPNLIPAEPRARARTVWYEEFADTIIGACVGKVFFNRVVAPKFMKRDGDQKAIEEGISVDFPKLVDYLETIVPASGFLVEDRITLADIAVASPFANLAHAGCAIDAASHPKSAAYVAGILARPSYAGWVAQEKAMLGAA
ncbi:glutathione S-transferase family protein [Phenylobacterium aquaticum]|uniref:glutathione S-transferase family protein n=1 Tax=Phenylobacterium aquaticum TaxID=1763816 RepID=UPI0026EEB163|nr:glutathione S-transferase family protein [Phenylobacterium aquaticum]